MGQPISLLEILVFLCLFSSSLVNSRTLEHDSKSTGNTSIATLKLYPLHSLSSSPFRSFREKALSVLKSDSDRVNFIYKKLNLSLGEKALYNLGEKDLQAQAPVNAVGGGYAVKIGIGTPPTQVYLIMDTGSDITWVDCKPCAPCGGIKFDPSTSTSYKPLTCDSPKCGDDGAFCSDDGTRCEYEVKYADQSKTDGVLVSESLTFDAMNIFENVAVGCSRDSEGNIEGTSGLLGLGGGSLSFPSQNPSASSFSYCMANREKSTSPTSTLEFSSSAQVPANAVTVPFLTESSFYVVGVTGISVGGQMLEATSFVGSRGGASIVDSGTTLTILPSELYNMLRDAFLGERFQSSDTCYQSIFEGPEVAFHFKDKVLLIPNENNFIQVGTNLFCFAYRPVYGRVSIIGNTLQQGMRVNYDLVTSSLSFSPNQC